MGGSVTKRETPLADGPGIRSWPSEGAGLPLTPVPLGHMSLIGHCESEAMAALKWASLASVLSMQGPLGCALVPLSGSAHLPSQLQGSKNRFPNKSLLPCHSTLMLPPRKDVTVCGDVTHL